MSSTVGCPTCGAINGCTCGVNVISYPGTTTPDMFPLTMPNTNVYPWATGSNEVSIQGPLRLADGLRELDINELTQRAALAMLNLQRLSLSDWDTSPRARERLAEAAQAIVEILGAISAIEALEREKSEQ